jgi:hypothetical protein
MNSTTALPAVSRACRIRRSGLSSEAETTTRADLFRQDHPPRMLPSTEWTELLTLDEMCDRYIQWMLDRCEGNRVAAAQFLRIGRTTLYRYLKEADVEKVDSATWSRFQGKSVPQNRRPNSQTLQKGLGKEKKRNIASRFYSVQSQPSK